MAISLVTVGGKITAAIQNAIIGQVNAQGLTSVIPTSVAGTGVTVGANGKVTVAAGAGAVSLMGVGTNFQVLKFIVRGTGSLAGPGADFSFRTRVGGTDNSGSNYQYSYNDTTPAPANTPGSSGGITQGLIGKISSTGPAYMEIEIAGMNATTEKEWFFKSANADVLTRVGSGRCFATTAYPDITFIPNAGTWSGTIQAYGYNNN